MRFNQSSQVQPNPEKKNLKKSYYNFDIPIFLLLFLHGNGDTIRSVSRMWDFYVLVCCSEHSLKNGLEFIL